MTETTGSGRSDGRSGGSSDGGSSSSSGLARAGRAPTSATRAVDAFADRFMTEPVGVWAAPGRVNVIGEHTDYNDGFVLPMALRRLTAVAAAPVDDPVWTVYSEATGETVVFDRAALDAADQTGTETESDRGALGAGGVSGWARYVAGVVWALFEAGFQVPGARLAIASDVPLGAGLSSSAALECAVLAALAALGDADLPTVDWPRLAQRAEAEYVGMPCGIMDQSASVLCRPGHVLFLDCRSQAIRHVPFDPAGRAMTVLVIDTRAPHRLVSGEYAARRRDCEAAARTLGVPALRDVTDLPGALGRLPEETQRRRVRHVVTENRRVLAAVAALDADDLAALGPLLIASHASMRDDYQITVPEVDTAVEAALAAGAYGARMTGGGFGGCVLALIEASAEREVTAAVTHAFRDAGFADPWVFPTTPGQGAHRVR